MRWVGRVVFGVMQGLATAWLILVSTYTTGARRGFVVASAITLGLGSTRSLFEGLRHRSEDSREVRRRNIANGLTAALAHLCEDGMQTPWYNVGLHVWVAPLWYRRLLPWKLVRLSPTWLRRILLRRTPSLRRVVKLRAVDKFRPSRIEWTRGKGVVGRCWMNRKTVEIHASTLYGPWLDADEDTWSSAREEVRMGMTLAEFHAIRTRYEAVLAVPLEAWRSEDSEKSGPVEVIGAVVVDTPSGFPESFAKIDAERILIGAASEISKFVR